MIDTAREDELLRIILEQDDQHKLDLTELATLRKAIDDRRTVEGWANAPDEERFYIVSRHIGNGKFTVTLTDMALMDPTDYEEGAIGPIHEYEFEFLGDTPDEAFSSAAEWVRGQG
jgi:hypothetical protein